uniref:Uncharacterized protein n=1 Tax=Meloidogyne enterolobii TaxID=390850 RepID=A0A6V7V3X7_MELEN|nr:unnamed protein product [Meloidogyne enterolobii]
MKKTIFVYFLLPFISPTPIVPKNKLAAKTVDKTDDKTEFALEHEALEQKLIDSHAKITHLKNVQFHIPDQRPIFKTNSVIFESKQVLNLADESKNFQQLIYCTEKVLLNEKYGENLLKLFSSLEIKNTNKIDLNNFKNINSLKQFENDLVQKIEDKKSFFRNYDEKEVIEFEMVCK